MKQPKIALAHSMAFGIVSLATVAVGADTHDYSTYAKLKATQTVTDGYPAAEKWDPASDMANGGYYIIPSGLKLTSKTGSASGYGDGKTWPADEIAIEGTFAATASGSRNYVAITPRLALCAGGTIALSSAYGTIKGDTIDIRGTADNPASFTYDYTSANDKPSYYAQVLSTLTASDPEAVVKFVRTKTDGRDLQRAYRVKGFSNYLGSVVVDGTNTWLRPETSATEFAIGGTLSLTNGGSFYVADVSPTVGTLKIGSNSAVQVVSGYSINITDALELGDGAIFCADTISRTFGSLKLGSGSTFALNGGNPITVTNSLEIADDAVIAVSNVAATAFVYDNGANSPPEVSMFSVCGAEAAAAVDREKLWAAVLRGGVRFKNTLASGIPRLRLVEAERADGGIDFKVSHYPVVQQTAACAASKGPYGFGNYEGYLSDGRPISPDKDYYTEKNIYTEKQYVFPGHSWSVSGFVGQYGGGKITATNLFFLSGAWFRQMSANGSLYLKGTATLYGNLNFRTHGSGAMYIESDLSGSGDIILSLDIEKIDPAKETKWAGTVELSGDNSDYKGRFLVGCGKVPTDPAKEGMSNQTLRVSAAKNLGGALDAFTFDSIKVADTCTFSVTDSATFEAANRGWCLMDGSTISISADKTVTVNETVTFGGTVTKAGSGTLVLGGPSKAYDTGADAPVDTKNGSALVVASGALGATAADAFVGLSSLTFGTDTKYVVSAASGSGADLSTVALTTPAGGVPVEFADIPESGANIKVATFATAEDAAKFAFVKPRGYGVKRSVEEVAGKFILTAEIGKTGLMLLFH